jgi:transposase
MGQTRKRHYDRYTLAYKLQAVRLANHPGVTAKDIAEALGIHVVMLYRWRMEHNRGELRENRHMKPTRASPKRVKKRTDPARAKLDELVQANRRIRVLERQLAERTEELDLLKKARRFFEKKKR